MYSNNCNHNYEKVRKKVIRLILYNYSKKFCNVHEKTWIVKFLRIKSIDVSWNPGYSRELVFEGPCQKTLSTCQQMRIDKSIRRARDSRSSIVDFLSFLKCGIEKKHRTKQTLTNYANYHWPSAIEEKINCVFQRSSRGHLWFSPFTLFYQFTFILFTPVGKKYYTRIRIQNHLHTGNSGFFRKNIFFLLSIHVCLQFQELLKYAFTFNNTMKFDFKWRKERKGKKRFFTVLRKA